MSHERTCTHQQVMAKGNLLFGSTLTMRSLQKTFSLAVSRQMAPASRIIVYTMKDGEILTDSLNFYVKDTRLLQVRAAASAGGEICRSFKMASHRSSA